MPSFLVHTLTPEQRWEVLLQYRHYRREGATPSEALSLVFKVLSAQCTWAVAAGRLDAARVLAAQAEYELELNGWRMLNKSEDWCERLG